METHIENLEKIQRKEKRWMTALIVLSTAMAGYIAYVSTMFF